MIFEYEVVCFSQEDCFCYSGFKSYDAACALFDREVARMKWKRVDVRKVHTPDGYHYYDSVFIVRSTFSDVPSIFDLI